MPYTMHDQTKHAWQQVLLILSCQRPSDTEFVHTSSRTEGGIPSDMRWILPTSLGSVLLHLTIHRFIASFLQFPAWKPWWQISTFQKRRCLPTKLQNRLIDSVHANKLRIYIVHQSINPLHIRVEHGKVQHLRCKLNATQPSNSPCFQATLGQRSWGPPFKYFVKAFLHSPKQVSQFDWTIKTSNQTFVKGMLQPATPSSNWYINMFDLCSHVTGS